MEQVPTETQIVQEKIRSALLNKVSAEFVRGAELLFALKDAYPDYEQDSRNLHDETIRALCIYAAYDVGEETGTVIRYSHQEVENIVGDGYNQQRVRTRNNFMVTSSDHTPPAYQQKRGITREVVSDYDLARRRETSNGSSEQTPAKKKPKSSMMHRKNFRSLTEKHWHRR